MFTDALPNRAERNCIRTRLTPPPISHTCTYLPLKVHTNIYILSINSHSSYSNSINSNIWLFIGRMGFFLFSDYMGVKEKCFFYVQDEQMDLTENQNGRIAHLSRRQALCMHVFVHVVLRPRWFFHPVPVWSSEGWTGCPNHLQCVSECVSNVATSHSRAKKKLIIKLYQQ